MTQSAGTTSAVSEAILSEIKRLSPDKVADPLKLADILYQGGCLDEAVPFYQRAYDTSADAPAKAWALFQMANCRRQTDAAAALTLYRRVTTEFPKSPWKVTANTECRLIEWRQSLVATPAKSGQTAASATSTAGKATSSATGTAAPKPTAAAPSKPAFAAPSVSAPDESAAAAAPESLTASAAVAPAATKTSAPQPRGPAVMVDGVLPTPTARAAEKEAPAAAEKAAPASPVAEKTTSAEADIPTAPAAASTASAGTDAPAAEPPVEEKTAPTPAGK
jgi:tetratricopeptide (TPR) repeat protein